MKQYLSPYVLIKGIWVPLSTIVAANLDKHCEVPGSLFHPHNTSFGPQFRDM